MARTERRSAAHYYTIDVVLNQDEAAELWRLRNASGGGDRASFTVTVGPTIAPADRPHTRRRRPVKMHSGVSPGIRQLYAHYAESGMTLERYARDRLGFSRQIVWYWFSNVAYPSPASRAQIKERTAIDIGPFRDGDDL